MAPARAGRVPTSVHDFVVLPLQIPAQPAFPKNATHYLYLRPNAPKAPTENTPRELFLVNVPTDATELHLRSLFVDQLGGVRLQSVAFEGARVGKGISAPVAPAHQGKKRKRGDDGSSDQDHAAAVGLLPDIWDRELRRSGGTAVVTFIDRVSAERALKETRRAVKNRKNIIWGGPGLRIPPLASARYLAHHKLSYPDPAILEKSVDAYMTAFAEQENVKAKLLARQRMEPDQDGFITVTKGGRAGPAREEEARAKEEELRKREKNRVGGDFYRFQVREKKKESAKDLIKGFEEDQRKVQELKRRRGKVRPE